MTETRFFKWPLWASLLAYFLLTAALVATIPLNASPDEAAHFLYVEHIATQGNLPVFRSIGTANSGYEFHQPPLYYLVCAPLWKLCGAGVQNYACRVVSLLCGLLTVVLVWGAARLFRPNDWRVAGLAGAFAALWPLHQGIGAGANNDAMGGLWSAALFFLMVRFCTRGVTWRDVWQVGLVAGLGILTKYTCLTVAATAIGALFIVALKDEAPEAPRPVMALGAAVGLALLLGGPILWRNQMLYGDPLAQGAFKAAFGPSSPGPAMLAQHGIDGFHYARGAIWIAFCTAWGFFGGPNTILAATRPLSSSGPSVPDLRLAPLMAVCALFPVLALLGWRRLEEFGVSDKATVRAWGVGILLVLLAWAQFVAQYFAGAQARYGQTALSPVCVLLATGWVGFLGRGRALAVASTIVGATLVVLTLLNIFVWKTLV